MADESAHHISAVGLAALDRAQSRPRAITREESASGIAGNEEILASSWSQNINGEPLMRLITALKLFGPELSNLIEERARARFGG